MLRIDPIVTSRLEQDWYIFLMQNFLCQNPLRNARVRYAMICRTKGAALGKVVPIEALREQFDHARTVMFTEDELGYLRESRHIPRGLFREAYLDELRTSRLPEVHCERVGDDLRVEVDAPWFEGMPGELVCLPVVNELACRYRLAAAGHTFADVRAEGLRRYERKVEFLRARPDVRFALFGLRRRATRDWEHELSARIVEDLPGQAFAVSNVLLAKLLGMPNAGTIAHQMPIVYAALLGFDDQALRESHWTFLREWLAFYGPRWTCPPTDTFGSKFFFEEMPRDVGELLETVKHDSADPVELARRYVIPYFSGIGRDPKGVVLNSTDGHTADSMAAVASALLHEMPTRFGWGTNLTFDLAAPSPMPGAAPVEIQPLSLVMKPVEAEGRPAIKLSDNLDKATGDVDEQARYKRAFRYATDYHSMPVY